MERIPGWAILALLLLALVLVVISGGAGPALSALLLLALAFVSGYRGVLIGVGVLVVCCVMLSAAGGAGIQTYFLLAVLVLIAFSLVALRGMWEHYRRTARLLSRVIEGLPAGVMITDAHGQVVRMNSLARALLGNADSANCTSRLEELGLPARWAASGEQSSWEAAWEGRMLHFTITPITVDDARSGVITTIVDMTAQERRDDFLALISHEMRNPLTAISGFAEILLGNPREEVLHRFAATIQRNAERITRLTHDLLQLRTMEQGHFTLACHQVDVRELLHRVVDDAYPAAQAAGVHVALRLPEEPIWGDYDPDRLAQVLHNLLDNACKYSPPGGEIAFTLTVSADEVRIAVRDHGPGIPEHELEEVFEKYYQAGTSRKRRRGFGLGLAVSREIVELHGGSLWAHNAEDGGAIFTMTLPRRLPTPLETHIR
jgi:two-component system sensor histidine kinase VicK